jgi:23S rRNA (adenine2030-N6)-methyltransferase
MNYRHAFHAGNFADCFKHALLVWCIRAIQRKDKPAFFLDTHAGIGRYDLAGSEASRTGEWLRGIARVRENPPPALADYVALTTALGEHTYAGSPELLCTLARPADRVALVDLHPEDAAALRRTYRGRAQVHQRDGYEALGALLPAPERRALVLIDPPFESVDEFDRLSDALMTVDARMRTAVCLAWYPIKDRADPRAFHDRLRESALSDLVAAELFLREPLDAARLNGCGMVFRNPPFGFEPAFADILDGLLARLGDGGPGAGTRLIRLADE